jgi:hypothetical protein
MGLVGVLSTQLLVDQFVRAFDARTPPHTEKVEATA